MEKSLIEKWLPIKKLSRDAEIEMAYKAIPAYIKHSRELKIPEKYISRKFYDPKIRNLHPWFARRPCSVARAITLAAVLPDTTDNEKFMKAIGWENKPEAFTSEGYPPLLFYTDPDRELINKLLLELLGKRIDEIVVCDPMAGGGAIPFESLRLGFQSIAVDYNPIAYLILKGTIEYPSKYGKKLEENVGNESKKLISYAENTLGKFYPDDSEGYILARGINCPNCEGLIPLLGGAQITKSNYLHLEFDVSKKNYNAHITKHPKELPYKGKKRGEILCPYCDTIMNRKQAYKTWTKNHISLLNELRNGIFNKDKILKTHILLVKQTKEGYKLPNETDFSCFIEACKTLMNSFKIIEKYIPNSQIPPNNEVFVPVMEYGIKYWYELFNPRQLLAIVNLIKYVQDRSKYLLSEKGELGVAISLYLAFGISRVIDYNSIATTWKRGTIRDTLGSYAQSRKITYGGEYCEAIIPYRNLNWIFEPNITNDGKTEGGIFPICSELCKRVENMGKNALILHGDSRFLSSLLPNTLVDVINVDPPYFDLHIYSDISEYFWQVFRIALKHLIENELLFKESDLGNWKPNSLVVPREGEIIARKGKRKGEKISGDDIKKFDHAFNEEWYTNQMSIFYSECFKILRNEGILLTWFTHRSLEAWKAIISSLYAGGFYVTKIWPVTSELLTRLVGKKNNSILNKTLIIVARKRSEEKISENQLKEYSTMLMEETCDILADMGSTESELRIFLLATAICAVTIAPLTEDSLDSIQYFKSELIPWAVKLVDDAFPIIIKRFNQKRPKGALEKFL